MPRVLLRNINIGFGAALAVILLIGIVSFLTIRALVHNSERVALTQEVIARGSHVSSLLADAESGQRGFIITGDPMYLEPYDVAAGSLTAEIDSLRALVGDDRTQKERVDRLETLMNERMQILAKGIRLRREKGFDSARVWTGSDRGRILMGQIRATVDAVKLGEQKALAQRDEAARMSAAAAVLLLLTGTLGALLLLAVTSRIIRRDVHRRADMEAALRHARDELEHRVEERTAELQAVIETSPLAITAIDLVGNIRIWNRAAERMFGYTADEMLGKPYQLLDAEDRAGYDEIMRQVRSGTPVMGYEVRRRRKDGSQIDLAIYSAPLRDGDRREIGFLGVIADLTEQKRLQDRLRQSQKMESIGKLAGGIAHDFNNLLTAITGYTDLLYLRLPGEIGKRELSEIRKSADRAASLTRQLLAFSRQQVLQPKIINVNEILSNLSAMLGRLIGEDVELATSLEDSIGRVKADPFQLEQVIMNLAVNARDAMPRGGKLTIETLNVHLDESYARTHPDVKPGPYVMIAVSDTGVGMDSETRTRIFEPFFTTKALGKGTGLGLSTVYGIVKQSHGHMWVYSEPGQGATFKVYLPRVEEPVELEGPAAVPARPTKRGWETILAVEDEESLLNLVGEILRDAGYSALLALGPKEALRVLHDYREDIHLLLTDVVMPGMSGRVLADQVQAERPGTRVLFMSGYTDNAIVHHGVLDVGVTFIQKPFTPDALMRKVRDVLDGVEVSA